MIFHVSYNISSDRIRKKLSTLLSEYGVRIQFSLFRCNLSKKELSELRRKTSELINNKKDSVLFIPLCENCLKKMDSEGAEYKDIEVSVLIT